MKDILRVIFISIFMLSFFIPHPSLAQSPRQKILIGILPEVNVFKQKQRFKPLGEYLSKKTGVAVEFTILNNYGNIIERFTDDKMDGAFFSSITGAIAIKKLGVIPLVRPVNPDGTSTYQGYLVVRKDSGITSVRDMRNKKMAYVDKATTAGYIFPLAYLRENGVAGTQHFFRETFFTGSHDAAISAVLNRKADVGAAKSSVYDLEKYNDPRVDKELVILAKSAHVPSNGLCVRKDLPEQLKSTLKSVLLGMHADTDGKAVLQQFGGLKFIETTSKDYQPVLDMAKKGGINVMTYGFNK